MIEVYDVNAILVVYHISRVSAPVENADLMQARIASLDGLLQPMRLLRRAVAKPGKGFSDLKIGIKAMKTVKIDK